MKFYSPLRYPGGKGKLAKFVSQICEDNGISGHYVEPYAGGAAVALYLLMEGKVSRITINDSDRAIYAFWHSVLKDTNRLCRLIQSVDVSVETWCIQKEVQKHKDSADLLHLGFSTLFLNRTNVSGILDGGIIGGLRQEGTYKIDCRFNKKALMERIRVIAAKKTQVRLLKLDALDLVKKIQAEKAHSSTIFYFDPPYYLKGESLYMNHYGHDDHKEVSEVIKKIKGVRWIVSYDNVPQIKSMYSGFLKKEYKLLHTARTARMGKEVLFFSKGLKIPRVADPVKM